MIWPKDVPPMFIAFSINKEKGGILLASVCKSEGEARLNAWERTPKTNQVFVLGIHDVDNINVNIVRGLTLCGIEKNDIEPTRKLILESIADLFDSRNRPKKKARRTKSRKGRK